ncbi:hypothetical protein SAMIE_4000450 (plasmid) [Sphingobium amiense]|uniref:Uncharacterized protein n=1 Tax=Sphingobium amiense TaxID=135719 RepID=A0A494WAZ0_9SPHN|nr:hypothetical protein SAMIE_4000450 [Sphingobium amiense]
MLRGLTAAALKLALRVTGLVTPCSVRLPEMVAVFGPVLTTLVETKCIVGNLAASNQSALTSSSSSVLLVVDTDETGTVTSSLAAARFFGLIDRLPLAPGKVP